PIHVINKDNLESELAQLSVEDWIKDWIWDYIDTHPNDTVTIPEDEFLYNDWEGTGWITLDSDKAFGGYYISGYLQGGMTTERYIPIITIVFPTDGEYYKPDESIECFGMAYERIPGTEGPGKDLSDTIEWEIVGPDEQTDVGVGKEVTFNPWMCGDYYLFAQVADTNGNMNSLKIKITVGLGERYNQYDEIIMNATAGKDILPEVEKGLIHQESVFSPYAVSASGAMGLCQFMPSTAQGEGLTTPMPPLPSGTPKNSKELYQKRKEFYEWVKTPEGQEWTESPEVTGSVWDVEAAIPAGAGYLQDRYDAHSWESGLERQRYALAGYNAGSGNVDRWQGRAMMWYKRHHPNASEGEIREFGTHWINLVNYGSYNQKKEEEAIKKKKKYNPKLTVDETIDYVRKIIGESRDELQGYALEYDP
ncbi:MAG: lytic transglycosylase domain-containing protein, partial [bacterium]